MMKGAVARSRPVFVAIGMGGNVGDPRRAFRLTLQTLHPLLRNPKISPLYLTSPVGGPFDQPDYLNAVVVGTTSLAAHALLALLRNVERAAGRKPVAEKDAPRPLDLDLLLYGDERTATRRLTVPHPRLTSRLFVLVPLADVAPRRVVPGTGKTVARLLAEARRRSTESVRRVRQAGVARAGARRAAQPRTGKASSG